MIVFIVPVKSKKLSKDWHSFSLLVERTLGSICQQSDQNYQVMVVCHELPLVKFKNNKLNFIQVKFDPPELTEGNAELNNSLKEKDKALKIKLGLEEAKKLSPNYFMVVDSDDCISNGVAEYVNSQKTNIPGWFMKSGFFYREGDRLAYLNRATFNTFCGSSLIINAKIIDQMFVENPLLSYNHKIDPLSLGLLPFPFPAALYSMGNGENHVMSTEKVQGLLNKPKNSIGNRIKSILSKVRKYKPQLLSAKFVKKFNFYPLRS